MSRIGYTIHMPLKWFNSLLSDFQYCDLLSEKKGFKLLSLMSIVTI